MVGSGLGVRAAVGFGVAERVALGVGSGFGVRVGSDVSVGWGLDVRVGTSGGTTTTGDAAPPVAERGTGPLRCGRAVGSSIAGERVARRVGCATGADIGTRSAIGGSGAGVDVSIGTRVGANVAVGVGVDDGTATAVVVCVSVAGSVLAGRSARAVNAAAVASSAASVGPRIATSRLCNCTRVGCWVGVMRVSCRASGSAELQAASSTASNATAHVNRRCAARPIHRCLPRMPAPATLPFPALR